ncbi:MAG: HEAT repeat domain-containing protein [Acidobacteriota bacterium]
MTRQVLSILFGLVLPAAAAAQVTPVPPVPPAPPAAPAPRVAPLPAPAPKPPVPPAAPRPVFTFDMPDINIDLSELNIKLSDMERDFSMNMEPMLMAQVVSRDQAQAMADQARAMADQAREQARMQIDNNKNFTTTFNFQQDAAGAGYRGGLDALQQRQYDRAITAFDRVIVQKGDRADAALYWKAFAQYRLARTDDTLASIAQLRRDYQQSRYLAEAKVLEADARKAAGQPVNPASANDDEIKLLAIQGLSKSDQAVPLLEGVLNATNALSVKKRALYVLALSDDTRAHQVLMRYAKGGGNPDLQVEAIRYLASRKDSKTTPTELRDIYDSSSDSNVKMAVVDAYRTWGDKPALLRISGDRNATGDLRRSAISRLGGLADSTELMTLYSQETDPAIRVQIVSALGQLGAVDQLTTIAKTDKDQNVRIRAIRALGNQRNDRMTQALVGLYGSEQDKEVRRAVIQSLMSQNNAETLVALARKETDVELKKELVRRISDMAPNSKAATDFLMEQLK